jgi:hypothetical protein
MTDLPRCADCNRPVRVTADELEAIVRHPSVVVRCAYCDGVTDYERFVEETVRRLMNAREG